MDKSISSEDILSDEGDDSVAAADKKKKDEIEVTSGQEEPEEEKSSEKMTSTKKGRDKKEKVSVPDKNKKARSPTSPTKPVVNDVESVSQHGRERKKVERFVAPTILPTNSKKATVVIPGIGEKLKDIPYIANQLIKTPSAECGYLHQLCFGNKGKKTECKKHILEFSGFSFDAASGEYEKRRTIIMKIDLRHLKPLSSILGLVAGKTKEERVNNLMEFCLKPQDEGKSIPKSKRSSDSKSKDSKDKPKSSSKKRKRKEDSEDEDNADNEEEEEDDEPPKKRSRESSKSKKKRKNSDSENETKSGSEDEEETPKKKPKKTPAKKPVSKPKAAKVSKPVSESEDDESDSSESEVEMKDLDIGKISNEELKSLVKQIIKKADLSAFSMKTMMTELKKRFKVETLESDKKILVRSFVDEILGTQDAS